MRIFLSFKRFFSKSSSRFIVFIIFSSFLFSCTKSRVSSVRTHQNVQTCNEILRQQNRALLVDSFNDVELFVQKGKIYAEKLEFTNARAVLVNYGSDVKSLYVQIDPKMPDINSDYLPDYAKIEVTGAKDSCGIGPECRLKITEEPIKTSTFSKIICLGDKVKQFSPDKLLVSIKPCVYKERVRPSSSDPEGENNCSKQKNNSIMVKFSKGSPDQKLQNLVSAVCKNVNERHKLCLDFIPFASKLISLVPQNITVEALSNTESTLLNLAKIAHHQPEVFASACSSDLILNGYNSSSDFLLKTPKVYDEIINLQDKNLAGQTEASLSEDQEELRLIEEDFSQNLLDSGVACDSNLNLQESIVNDEDFQETRLVADSADSSTATNTDSKKAEKLLAGGGSRKVFVYLRLKDEQNRQTHCQARSVKQTLAKDMTVLAKRVFLPDRSLLINDGKPLPAATSPKVNLKVLINPQQTSGYRLRLGLKNPYYKIKENSKCSDTPPAVSEFLSLDENSSLKASFSKVASHYLFSIDHQINARGVGDYILSVWLKFPGMKAVCTSAALLTGPEQSSAFSLVEDKLISFKLSEKFTEKDDNNAEVTVLEVQYKHSAKIKYCLKENCLCTSSDWKDFTTPVANLYSLGSKNITLNNVMKKSLSFSDANHAFSARDQNLSGWSNLLSGGALILGLYVLIDMAKFHRKNSKNKSKAIRDGLHKGIFVGIEGEEGAKKLVFYSLEQKERLSPKQKSKTFSLAEMMDKGTKSKLDSDSQDAFEKIKQRINSQINVLPPLRNNTGQPLDSEDAEEARKGIRALLQTPAKFTPQYNKFRSLNRLKYENVVYRLLRKEKSDLDIMDTVIKEKFQMKEDIGEERKKTISDEYFIGKRKNLKYIGADESYIRHLWVTIRSKLLMAVLMSGGVVTAAVTLGNQGSSDAEGLLVELEKDCSLLESYDEFYCEFKNAMRKVEALAAKKEDLEKEIDKKKSQ